MRTTWSRLSWLSDLLIGNSWADPPTARSAALNGWPGWPPLAVSAYVSTSPTAMTGFSSISALSAAAGTAKLTANAPAAMPTIHLSRVRRLARCGWGGSPGGGDGSAGLPGDAVLSRFKVCFMADKGLLIEEQQESKVEAAGARSRPDDGC